MNKNFLVLVLERSTKLELDTFECSIDLSDLHSYSSGYDFWILHRCLNKYIESIKNQPNKQKKLEGKDWFIDCVEID